MRCPRIGMKHVMLAVGVAVFGLHVGPVPALADSPSHTQTCRNSTLKGRYIFTQDGWESRAPSTSQPAGDRRPFAYAGQEEYDGRGRFTGVNTLATARRPDQAPPVAVSPFIPYSGTYTVNPDCTVLWSSVDEDGFTSTYHLFLSPDGEKFTFISVDAQVISDGAPVIVQEAVGVGVAHRVDNRR
jgi:hypothetical protein